MEKDLKVIPLIPSLNPENKLIKYVDQLIEVGFKKIIVVNDGSSEKYDHIFKKIEKKKECTVLRHSINQGKGRALKTGFNYFLNNYADYVGVVTADADGQHSAKDTYEVAKTLSKKPETLVLGTRNFDEPQVPFKSRYGNKITTFVFKLLYGKLINDTQTGLRGIATKDIKRFLSLEGEKFDYEINMLIDSVKNNVKIEEVTIETIYFDDNRESHFNAVKDSIKVYKIMFSNFFKFTFSGIFSAIVDLVLFSIFIALLKNVNIGLQIFLATLFARIISSFINYSLNHNVVFNTKENKKTTIVKYYILCAMQMLVSFVLVTLIYTILPINKTAIKTIVDLILFFISYRIQRNLIFK